MYIEKASAIKRADGSLLREGKVASERCALSEWAKHVEGPWCGGLEATICSHWIYEHLKPYAAELKMAAPARLKAITAGKRKTDQLDARALADLLRCDLFPSCYVPPATYQVLRRQLHERALLVRTKVMFKNKIAGLLIESGVPYETRPLHGKAYFAQLIEENAALVEDIKALLAFNRTQIDQLQHMDELIIKQMLQHPLLRERVERLQSIPGVGAITSLTWAVETGEPSRFPNEAHAISYCGLCAAQRESAGMPKRGPISKQRNHSLQTTLVEAAHMAVQHNEKLQAVYEAARQNGHRNRAILEVARRLVRYLLAIDRQYFASPNRAAA